MRKEVKIKVTKIIVIMAVIIFLLAVFFLFIYRKNCEDETCFKSALLNCYRARYINNAKDVIWEYKIMGYSGEFCKVNVKVLESKSGVKEIKILENKEMDCYIPEGVIINPEVDISNCHGRLKEEMQELMINKLHQYILENVGEIGEELKSAV